jgi:hypothetical protein
VAPALQPRRSLAEPTSNTGNKPRCQSQLAGSEALLGSSFANSAWQPEESISGYFTFDPLTDIEYIAQIQFTGPAPYGGLYGYETERIGKAAVELGGLVANTFLLANDLPDSGADPLVSVYFDGAFDPDPTGFVCAASCTATVPEPTSLAILGTALGLFLVSSRAIRRVGQRHPDKTDGA